MSVVTNFKRRSSAPTLKVVPPSPKPTSPTPMRVIAAFGGEVHAISSRMASISRRVDGWTTDLAVAQARAEMAELAARLLKLSKAPAQ